MRAQGEGWPELDSAQWVRESWPHAARHNLMSRARRTPMEHSSSQIGAWFSPASPQLAAINSGSSRQSGANETVSHSTL